MTRSTVLKSFAELADAFEPDELVAAPAPKNNQWDPDVSVADTAPVDLAVLLADLEQAGALLSTINRGDQEERVLALRDLERYDLLVAQQREAETVRDRAGQMRRDAENLAARGFSEEARAEADRIAGQAARAEVAAADLAKLREGEVKQLAARLDVERLLVERQRQQEEEKAKAAEAEQARRLSGALAGAKSALTAGQLQEAKELLGTVVSENPNNPEVASLKNMIAQRELTIKIEAAEDALWTARREYRQDPGAAVARLAALDMDSLPEPLARQVFGEWARACARLCRASAMPDPLRYAPDPGCGAIIARESPDGGYVVVSSLGMGSGWQPGRPVSERHTRLARPLR